MTSSESKISVKLVLGILFFPYIFSWFTLRTGVANGTRVFAFLWMVLAIAMVRSNSSNRINVKDMSAAQNSKEISTVKNNSKPFDLPLSHEPEAEAIDSITIIGNLQVLLKDANWYELYRFSKSSAELMGANCSLPVCRNLKSTLRVLARIANDPKDYDTRMEAESSLRDSTKEVEMLKKSRVYKTLNKKPNFISDDGIYVVEQKITNRNECKLFGDTIKIYKKKSLVIFVSPGKSISRQIASNEYQNISCVYIYNYGLKNRTRVLLTDEISGNWD